VLCRIRVRVACGRMQRSRRAGLPPKRRGCQYLPGAGNLSGRSLEQDPREPDDRPGGTVGRPHRWGGGETCRGRH
jgi:hypothetical protein